MACLHVDFVLFIVASLLYRMALVSNHHQHGGRRRRRRRRSLMMMMMLLHARDAAMSTMVLLALWNPPGAAYCVLLWSTVVLSLAVVA
jgi:hypothetical protein